LIVKIYSTRYIYFDLIIKIIKIFLLIAFNDTVSENFIKKERYIKASFKNFFSYAKQIWATSGDKRKKGSFHIEKKEKKKPEHKDFMAIALEEARKAENLSEVPVGAVLVDNKGKIISKGYNLCLHLFDPTAHAEIIAIREAGQLQTWERNLIRYYRTLYNVHGRSVKRQNKKNSLRRAGLQSGSCRIGLFALRRSKIKSPDRSNKRGYERGMSRAYSGVFPKKTLKLFARNRNLF